MMQRAILEIEHPQADASGRQLVAIGGFPRNVKSVCAEVLVRLLEGEELTALDTWHGCSTMRLAAHRHYLAAKYGWPIVSEAREVFCVDGRMATIACYRLPQDVIFQAFMAGAGSWVLKVRRARVELRRKKNRIKPVHSVFHRQAIARGIQGDLFQGVCGGEWAQ